MRLDSDQSRTIQRRTLADLPPLLPALPYRSVTDCAHSVRSTAKLGLYCIQIRSNAKHGLYRSTAKHGLYRSTVKPGLYTDRPQSQVYRDLALRSISIDLALRSISIETWLLRSICIGDSIDLALRSISIDLALRSIYIETGLCGRSVQTVLCGRSIFNNTQVSSPEIG